MKHGKWITLGGALTAAMTAGACNMFTPFDHPTTDPQLLSAAQAAFDQGDYATATQLYGKLANQTDETLADNAYLLLAESGATMANFTSAFGTGKTNLGVAITQYANSMIGQAGATARQNIFKAYQATASISNPGVRGLVRFFSSTAMLAETLAEKAAGTVSQSELVTDPAGCASSSPSSACVANAGCAAPALNSVPTGTAVDANNGNTNDLDKATSAPDANLYTIDAAVQKIQYALGTEIKGGGGSFNFADNILSFSGGSLLSTSDKCFRYGLISEKIGATN